MDIEKLKKRCGYDGKPQQWQYGFDLACRELAKAQAIPDGFVLVPKEPTEKMLDAARRRQWDDLSSPLEDMDVLKYKAMIEAAQEPTNDQN